MCNSIVAFLVFPEGCQTYNGPQVDDCYVTIWKETGCTEQGHQYPGNLTAVELEFLDRLNLEYVLNFKKALLYVILYTKL